MFECAVLNMLFLTHKTEDTAKVFVTKDGAGTFETKAGVQSF